MGDLPRCDSYHALHLPLASIHQCCYGMDADECNTQYSECITFLILVLSYLSFHIYKHPLALKAPTLFIKTPRNNLEIYKTLREIIDNFSKSVNSCYLIGHAKYFQFQSVILNVYVWYTVMCSK